MFAKYSKYSKNKKEKPEIYQNTSELKYFVYIFIYYICREHNSFYGIIQNWCNNNAQQR